MKENRLRKLQAFGQSIWLDYIRRDLFAPNSKHRAPVDAGGKGQGPQSQLVNRDRSPPPVERRASMTWAQRLKRVFNIDIETSRHCAAAVRIIACTEDPVVIQKILTHLANNATTLPTDRLPSVRAPPDRHH